MRKIQLRHSLVSGSEAEYGSGGQMCRGWVRHVRGVYDSANIRSEILRGVFHLWLDSSRSADTYIFSSLLYPFLAKLYDVGFLAQRPGRLGKTVKGRPTASAYWQLGTTGLMILAGIHCIGFIICSPHIVWLHMEGLMGLVTDNILGLTDSERMVLVLCQILLPELRTSRMSRVYTT
jgi:hypothetical protein